MKRNYKGELGWEYTVKGETIDEVGVRNKNMISFINKNVQILVTKDKDEKDRTDTPE